MAQTRSAQKFATNNPLIPWKDQDENRRLPLMIVQNAPDCTRGEANRELEGFPGRGL
jgi:hypothetical protein